jgi:hypothetical protein
MGALTPFAGRPGAEGNAKLFQGKLQNGQKADPALMRIGLSCL